METYIDAGTARETGRRLGLAEQTVKNTLASIRRKAGTRSTMQAIYLLLTER